MALKFHMGGRTLSGKIACACCSWILLSLATKFSAAAQTNVVVVRPKPIHNVLVNPGMGITTFQRFNGQELNPPLKRSEEHTSELQSRLHLVCRLLLEKKKKRRCTRTGVQPHDRQPTTLRKKHVGLEQFGPHCSYRDITGTQFCITTR